MRGRWGDVKLTQWTKIVRKNASRLPISATEVSGKHLKDALCTTHKLRHAAVHRLRISTTKIRSMMTDTVVLAKILKDQRQANSIARLLEALTKGHNIFHWRSSSMEESLAARLAQFSLQKKELDVVEYEAINDATKKYDRNRSTLFCDLETIVDQATNQTLAKSGKETEHHQLTNPNTAAVCTTAESQQRWSRATETNPF